MAKKVDHDARRQEIAAKAIKLFSQVGYDNVSLIMIAAACGISRTVIYRYFCSKRETLDAAIGLVTGRIESLSAEAVLSNGTAREKLERVCHIVAEVMFENKEFLIAVFDFVVASVRTGADMTTPLKEFTAGSRQIISRLVEMGKRRGEFDAVLQVPRTTDILYSEFESCAMRIALGTEKNADAAKQRFTDIIRAISTWR